MIMTPRILKSARTTPTDHFPDEFAPLLELPRAKEILKSLFYDTKNITITSRPGPRKSTKGSQGPISSNHKGWDVAPFHPENRALIPIEAGVAHIGGLDYQLKSEPKGFGHYLKAEGPGYFIFIAHLDIIEKTEFGIVSRYARVGSSGNVTGVHAHLEWRSYDRTKI